MSAGTYHVYILASRKYGTLYIGVTNDLPTKA
jgi:predicted GIY-YIG superfamily endonuclease